MGPGYNGCDEGMGCLRCGEGTLAQGYVFGSGDYVGEFQVDGPVTCMLVVGNRASIKYRFRHASGRAPRR